MPLSRTLPKNSHVLWLISLIQDTSPGAQTKSEFADMVSDILSNDYVEKITICVGDTLQRFRFMIKHDCTELEAIEKCKVLSDQWYQDNPESLEKLKEKKNLVIMKWDEFLAWPDREKTIKAVEDFYLRDHKFKRDVDARIKQEMAKYTDAKITHPLKQTELLKKYLFEESAFQRFSAEKDFRHVLYKMPFPPAMKRVLANSDFVPPGYMVETHFTQYAHKMRPPANNETPQEDKVSFQPVFSHSPTKPENNIKSQTKKVADIIENTIELLSPDKKEFALKALLEFTTKEIMPLYLKDIPTLTN